MTEDVREQSIEDLEVSVKTASILASLGVSTVGELMGLQEIAAPRLVLAELQCLFQDLGLEYQGTFSPLESLPGSVAKATGSVVERWQTIQEYLEKEFPDTLFGFRPPATGEAIAATEKALGHQLPEDYKQFLAIHNGQRANEPWVAYGTLLPVEEVARTWSSFCADETPVEADLVGEGIRSVVLSPGWIPIGISPRGRDFLCLDLDPGPEGQRGQILEYIVDDDSRSLVAASFADLLSLYFEQVQSGEIELED